MLLGQLIHEEKGTVDTDAGFATVEESSVGKKSIDRGKTMYDRMKLLKWIVVS